MAGYWLTILLAAGLLGCCSFVSAEDKAAVDADVPKANSYDNAWKNDWVMHLRDINKRAKGKTPGFVIHLGDSITHDSSYSQFAQNYKGNDDLGRAIVWSKAGGPDTGEIAPDCKNGWSLSWFNVKSDKPKWRSYTACKGITAGEFLTGTSRSYCFVAGPGDKTPLDTLLNNKSKVGVDGYNVAIVYDAQIAIVMLGTNDVGGEEPIDKIAANLKTIAQKLEAKDIMPILSTIPQRRERNDRVIQLNDKIRALTKELKVPLIDFYAEIERRGPNGTWQDTMISEDGVHLTMQGYRDPVKDPEWLSKSGALLRGFLSTCKIMEVKAYVIDGANPPGFKVPKK
jgi:hypothetical protein